MGHLRLVNRGGEPHLQALRLKADPREPHGPQPNAPAQEQAGGILAAGRLPKLQRLRHDRDHGALAAADLEVAVGRELAKQLRSIRGGFRTVTVGLDLEFDPDTYDLVQALRDGTEGSLTLVFANNSISPAKSLTITVPSFKVDEIPDDLSMEDIITNGLQIEAEADDSDDDITYAFS